jgi:hypothetical protein
MFIVFFGSLMLSDSPLNAVQMLWVNLIMDTLAALALATEPPDLNILERMPQPSSTSIVTEIMWRNVYGHAIYQMIVLVVVIFVGQGSLVQTYDVKCLLDRPNNGPCPAKGLNPFYAADLYFELETKKYWDQIATKPSNLKPEAYQPDKWAEYQCQRLNENHEDQMSNEDCNPQTYQALLKKYLVNLSADETALLGKEKKFYLPNKTPAGTGTEKVLHMTYVF